MTWKQYIELNNTNEQVTSSITYEKIKENIKEFVLNKSQIENLNNNTYTIIIDINNMDLMGKKNL